MSKTNSNDDYRAMQQANSDIGGSNDITELDLEDFFDDRKSSKCDDEYYEEGDGAFEIAWKKLIGFFCN